MILLVNVDQELEQEKMYATEWESQHVRAVQEDEGGARHHQPGAQEHFGVDWSWGKL